MKISDFIGNYHNHPVLFIGTGISLRYLQNSYTWDQLLKTISEKLKGNSEYYLDIKSKCEENGEYNYPKIASILESEFNDFLLENRSGEFKLVNDIFYENMQKNINISRFKIYISQILSSISIKKEMEEEVSQFKKTRKNIGSIITTNYDKFIEDVFAFEPLVGNDILLSNPYGSVYKIHGCIDDPIKIIVSEEDYLKFDSKYELIRAQLLSIFIHNPIIFLGYSLSDNNIKSLLKTIFTYVKANSIEAEKIRSNFLLVEYEKESNSDEIVEHDIDIEGFSTIRINKIKTDNYIQIYEALSNIVLPISAMDVRKVQSIVKEIYAGGNIQVNITENLDSLDNKDKIIAIGSSKTIQYQFHTVSEIISNYFSIIDESNSQLLVLINKHKIHSTQYFPIFGFSVICKEIEKVEELKKYQIEKIKSELEKTKENCKSSHVNIDSIFGDMAISNTNKASAIIWAVMYDKIALEDLENFLIKSEDKNTTIFRKLICVYDLKKYK